MSLQFKKSEPQDPAPEGLQQAVCVDVVDLGLVETQWGKQPKFYLSWATEHTNHKTGKPFVVSKRYTASLHEKSSFRKDLETWKGRRMTKEEIDTFDSERLIGANCQLQVAHNITDDGKTYANVQAIVPISSKMTKLRVPEGYVRAKDRDQNGNGGGEHNGNGNENGGW